MLSVLATRRVSPTKHGGAFGSGQPRLVVIHSMETPIAPGAAYNAARYVAQKGLSVHYLVDANDVVGQLDEGLVGYGAGTVNTAAIHVEFAGYAGYSRAEWSTPAATSMIDRGRRLIADITARHAIPCRFLTDAQLAAAFRGTGPGGLTTHAQCTRVIGGTTHTDPGPNFPLPLLLGAPASPPRPPQPTEDDLPTISDLLNTRIAVRNSLTTNPDQNPTLGELLAALLNYSSTAVVNTQNIQKRLKALEDKSA